MINTNELRIGNWIKSMGINLQLTQEHLVAILRPDKLAIHTLERSEPIPLTEEWLKRFGFEDYEEGDLPWGTTGDNVKCIQFHPKYSQDYYSLQMNVYRYEDTHLKGSFKICFQGYGILYSNYVHELQNLFFVLTGEELTVKQEANVHS